MDDTGKLSILNVGEFAKPVNTLIERLSDVISGALAPGQIVRMAKAEADSKIILAKADVTASLIRSDGEAEIQRRAVHRLISESTTQQRNLEAVIGSSLDQIAETARPQEIDEDWLTHFVSKAKLVGNSEVRKAWSRILAGEANHPGSYAKRTLNILSEIGKEDALLFEHVCSFACTGDLTEPLIFDLSSKVYQDLGITVDVIGHLQSLGLLQYETSRFTYTGKAGSVRVTYFDQSIILKSLQGRLSKIDGGLVRFTRSGRELGRICHASKVDGFSEFLLKHWAKHQPTFLSSVPEAGNLGKDTPAIGVSIEPQNQVPRWG